MRFKTREPFISANFHLTFSDHGWPWATKTKGSKTTDLSNGSGHGKYAELESQLLRSAVVSSAMYQPA